MTPRSASRDVPGTGVRRCLVEACVDSVASALAAERGGASRLELCDALYDGGTTPSMGMIEAVREQSAIPVFVIVRPRGGGFVYSADEVDVMRRDVRAAIGAGAAGIVIGALTDTGTVDVAAIRTLVDAAEGAPVTFHRAFDLTPSLPDALETLMTRGITRVLTSGGAQTAIDGADAIADLVQRAGDRLTIMAGGGIREETVQEIVHRSGVHEVHVRGTRVVRTPGSAPRIRLRKELPSDQGAWEETDEQRIRAFVAHANAG